MRLLYYYIIISVVSLLLQNFVHTLYNVINKIFYEELFKTCNKNTLLLLRHPY